MFVVNDTSLISISPVFCATFLQPFFFSILFPLLPLCFHFSLISLFFNSFISHFYTITAVDTCSLRLPIFIDFERKIFESVKFCETHWEMTRLKNVIGDLEKHPEQMRARKMWRENVTGAKLLNTHKRCRSSSGKAFEQVTFRLCVIR